MVGMSALVLAIEPVLVVQETLKSWFQLLVGLAETTFGVDRRLEGVAKEVAGALGEYLPVTKELLDALRRVSIPIGKTPDSDADLERLVAHADRCCSVGVEVTDAIKRGKALLHELGWVPGAVTMGVVETLEEICTEVKRVRREAMVSLSARHVLREHHDTLVALADL